MTAAEAQHQHGQQGAPSDESSTALPSPIKKNSGDDEHTPLANFVLDDESRKALDGSSVPTRDHIAEVQKSDPCSWNVISDVSCA